ncbi:MAG: hypothetical protein IJ192_15100 [Clostridia bacterium]|nr:hypothetical protein [Clostridia bacterium]
MSNSTKIKYTDFTMIENGFVGHMAEPESHKTDKAVIVIMGGEKSVLPGIKIAERFADFGITGLSVSLFGAEGLPDAVSAIPIDMFEAAVKFLQEKRRIKSISIYGMSMGSIFAALAAEYVGGIDNLILCSPSHVPFEGSEKDKKTMTGHSVAAWRGRELPFVSPDFSEGKMGKYVFDKDAGRKVTRMWIAYRNAYLDKEKENKAALHLEKTGARILLVAGTGDEAWPSDYSANYIKQKLDKVNYPKEYKLLLYPNASHLIGVMPNRERNRGLYRILPLIGLMYRSIKDYPSESMKALEQSEKEVIDWILRS